MKKALVLGSIFGVLAVPVLANDVSIQFTDETAGLNLNVNSPDGRMSVSAGATHNDDDDVQLYEAGFYVNGKRGRIDGRVGAKAYYGDFDAIDGGALAVGLEMRIPSSDVFSIRGSWYYAPGTTSMGDLEGFNVWNVGAELMLLDNAALEAGICKTAVQIENVSGDYEFQDGAYLKLKMLF